MTDVSVTIGRTALKNPVLAASGTAAFGHDAKTLELAKLGGIVLKTVTPAPRQGNPPPRIAETPSGVLNAIGLENPGIDALCEQHLPMLSACECAVLVSIHADGPDEIRSMAERLSKEKNVAAVEINLSCPNVKDGTTPSRDPDLAFRFVSAADVEAGKPLWAKISPDSPDIVATAQATADAGAEAVVISNTYPGATVNWRTSQPLLGAGTGGLSGPAVRPLTLYRVGLVRAKVNVAVIASGGAFSADDVLQFLSVGASAVEIGTANLVDPAGMSGIPDKLAELLAQEGKKNVLEIIGSINIFDGR